MYLYIILEFMKKLTFLLILLVSVIITWCDPDHNFMDVDNPNAKEDLLNIIWTWNIPTIDTENIIPDSLSWARETAKWYIDKYYDDSIEWYVNRAKEWISWATETLKWYYNEWVDELNWIISDKVNWAISEEMNKFKIK